MMLWTAVVVLVSLIGQITAVPLGKGRLQPVQPVLLTREEVKHSVSEATVCNLEGNLDNEINDHKENAGIKVKGNAVGWSWHEYTVSVRQDENGSKVLVASKPGGSLLNWRRLYKLETFTGVGLVKDGQYKPLCSVASEICGRLKLQLTQDQADQINDCAGTEAPEEDNEEVRFVIGKETTDLQPRYERTKICHKFTFDSWTSGAKEDRLSIWYEEELPPHRPVEKKPINIQTYPVVKLAGIEFSICIRKSHIGLNYDRKKLRIAPVFSKIRKSFALVAADKIDKDQEYDCPDVAVFTSDPHGDLTTFKRTMLLSGLFKEEGTFVDWEESNPGCFIITGDILDRGDQDKELWQELMRLKKQAGTGQKLIITLGNHEQMNAMNDLHDVFWRYKEGNTDWESFDEMPPDSTASKDLHGERLDWVTDHAEDFKSLPAIAAIRLPSRKLALALHANIHVSLLEENGKPNQYFEMHQGWDSATKVSYLNHVVKAEIACYLRFLASRFNAQQISERCSGFTTAAGLMNRHGAREEEEQPSAFPYPHILWNRIIAYFDMENPKLQHPKLQQFKDLQERDCQDHRRMLQILGADLVVAGHTANDKIEKMCQQTFIQTDVAQSRFMNDGLEPNTVMVVKFEKGQTEPSILSQAPPTAT